jgi:autotransporter passenger strand-loop-strand repeat protein
LAFKGAVVIGTSVGAGGTQFVRSDTVTGSIIKSGGLVEVEAGGTTTGTLISRGGLETVLAGGHAVGTRIYGVSGTLLVETGATATGTVVSGFKTFEQVQAGAVTSNCNVFSGGTEYISAGGVAKGTGIYGGGSAVLFGTASGMVDNDGVVAVNSGGVLAGGTVRSGGQVFVVAHGTATALVVSSGASGIVQSGGMASATSVVLGALTVSAGGSLTGGLSISGGKAIISGTVAAGQVVKYGGAGGTLALTNGASFAATISGLTGTADKIDLLGFAYNSATETKTFTEASGNTSGTLVVSSGGVTESLTLLGNYVTSNFILSSDGTGGTLIVDPPLKKTKPAFLAATHEAAPADWRAMLAPVVMNRTAETMRGAYFTSAPVVAGGWSAAVSSASVLALLPRHPA